MSLGVLSDADVPECMPALFSEQAALDNAISPANRMVINVFISYSSKSWFYSASGKVIFSRLSKVSNTAKSDVTLPTGMTSTESMG